MNYLRRLMYGRYGSDKLSMALLMLYLLLSMVGWLTRLLVLDIVAYVPLALCFLRMFSRNTVRRYEENRRFLAWCGGIKSWLLAKQSRVRGMKTHRYYSCPRCTKKLRVPKGKGRINIKCPYCNTQFMKKT